MTEKSAGTAKRMVQRTAQGLPGLFVRLFLFVFPLALLSVFSDSVIPAVLYALLLILLGRRTEWKGFPVVLTMAAFAVRLFAVYRIPVPVQSDYEVLYEASRQLAAGSRQYLEQGYFRQWGYQIGYVWFQACLLRIRDSLGFLKAVNCLAGAGTTLLVWLLSAELAGKRAAGYAAVFYCFAPVPVLYTAFLSNQPVPLFLTLLGMYILFRKRPETPDFRRYQIFGVLMAAANVLRPESIVPVAAVLFYLVVTMRRDKWKEYMLSMAVLAVSYAGCLVLFSALFRVSGIAPQGLVNGAPWMKMVFGLNQQTKGMYSVPDEVYLTDPEGGWAVVKARLREPLLRMYHLFEQKIAVFWGDSSLDWVFGHFLENNVPLFGDPQKTRDIVILIEGVGRWFHFAAYGMTAAGAAAYLRSRRDDDRILAFYSLLMMTLAAFLIVEVQARYAFTAQAAAAVTAAAGIEWCLQKKTGTIKKESE